MVNIMCQMVNVICQMVRVMCQMVKSDDLAPLFPELANTLFLLLVLLKVYPG